MRISDWSSDVCSSDLRIAARDIAEKGILGHRDQLERVASAQAQRVDRGAPGEAMEAILQPLGERESLLAPQPDQPLAFRSEEHTSELQSLMRISYAVL